MNQFPNNLNYRLPQDNLCEHCHIKPKHTGQSVCSKPCLIALQQLQTSQTQEKKDNRLPSTDLCERCHLRPKHQGESVCSRICLETLNNLRASQTQAAYPSSSSTSSTTAIPHPQSTPLAQAQPVKEEPYYPPIEMQALFEHVENSKPSAANPLLHEVNGTLFAVWWNPTYQSMNIQPGKDWQQSKGTNKLSISLKNRQFQYRFNNEQIPAIPKPFEEIIVLLEQKTCNPAVSNQSSSSSSSSSSVTSLVAPTTNPFFSSYSRSSVIRAWFPSVQGDLDHAQQLQVSTTQQKKPYNEAIDLNPSTIEVMRQRLRYRHLTKKEKQQQHANLYTQLLPQCLQTPQPITLPFVSREGSLISLKMEDSQLVFSTAEWILHLPNNGDPCFTKITFSAASSANETPPVQAMLAAKGEDTMELLLNKLNPPNQAVGPLKFLSQLQNYANSFSAHSNGSLVSPASNAHFMWKEIEQPNSSTRRWQTGTLYNPVLESADSSYTCYLEKVVNPTGEEEWRFYSTKEFGDRSFGVSGTRTVLITLPPPNNPTSAYKLSIAREDSNRMSGEFVIESTYHLEINNGNLRIRPELESTIYDHGTNAVFWNAQSRTLEVVPSLSQHFNIPTPQRTQENMEFIKQSFDTMVSLFTHPSSLVITRNRGTDLKLQYHTLTGQVVPESIVFQDTRFQQHLRFREPPVVPRALTGPLGMGTCFFINPNEMQATATTDPSAPLPN